MKVYIRKNAAGRIYNANMYTAYAGFLEKEAEIHYYTTIHSLTDTPTKDIVVGLYTDLHWLLNSWGIDLPEQSYPEELQAFLGRKLWKSTLFTITNHPEQWHVFVKPVHDVKRFKGTVLDETKDLVRLGGLIDDIEVWCSEKVEFRSEWRAYVLEGKILGLYRYDGDWRLYPDPEVVAQAVEQYRQAPRGYAIDFGITPEGKTLLVEVNDGFGLGNYGLEPKLYAQLLAARWEELTENLEVPELSVEE